MAKYLIQATYTAQGAKGLLKEGATGRKKAIEKAVKSIGGKVDAMYWGLGQHDAFLIVDLADNSTAAALSLAVGSSGAVRTDTTALMTVEEVDAACKQAVKYRPPG
jgi:uncharacterized protein with GYD domain